jgi:glycosyltransferase involved in cell wall biosynthesis
MVVLTSPGAVSKRFRSIFRASEALEITSPHWATHRLVFEDLWLPGAIHRSGCEVFFNPDFTLPFTYRGKGVVTVHDLSVWDVPQSKSLKALLLYRTKMPSTFRRVQRVITVSRGVERDLARRFMTVPGRIVTIPNGVASGFKRLPKDARREQLAAYGLTIPFVLGVGTLEPLKNWTAVAEALTDPAHREFHHLHFVHCGGAGRQAARIKERLEKRLPGRVHFFSHAEPRVLQALYSACFCYIHPSLYDSFGLPVLEAMACGAPALVSRAPSLPETAGDAALLFDPRRPAELTQALGSILRNASLRSRLQKKGFARARLFKWDRAARRVWEVLHDVRQEP